VRHPTRYGLPDGETSKESSRLWLKSNGQEPHLDRALGLRRGRAATLLTMAVPGSVYLYQGEELGLHEVGDLPDEVRQDPAFHRTGGEAKGRDGCRVPLPWTLEGPSLGFGDHVGHLPQPGWFAELSVEAQEHDLASTLNLYRRALGVRRSRRAAGDAFGWVDSDSHQVLHFRRPGGWHSLTNFGCEPVELPSGSVAVSSDALEGDRLPPNTTAWIIEPT
jgi:alpha-glucosidase